MAGFIETVKRLMPKPIKALLRPIYHWVIKLFFKPAPKTYKDHLHDEITRFNDEIEVNDLPEIFHYWSNKYLVPKLTQHGFNNPDEFFLKYAIQAIKNNQGNTTILSIGAGNCDAEVLLAKNLTKQGYQNFIIECMDINQAMFDRGLQRASEQGVADKMTFLQADFNKWQAHKSYDLIIANQSLHHVVELEHLYDNIKLALTEHGKFITSDVIGRNGHQRWPEAVTLIEDIWRKMPKKYMYNHAMQRLEKKFINHDCSSEGFEGIRAQDVLPLMIERFEFDLFIPFANIVMIFIDRPFGPNFDVNDPDDLSFIDAIHETDEKHIYSGTIKPTMMFAVLKTKSEEANSHINRAGVDHLTPEFCVRQI